MKTFLKHSIAGLCLLLALVAQVFAVDEARSIETSKRFGDYTLHYNVFNSSMLTAEVANAYGFTRAENQVLVNIAVTKGSSLGLPAKIRGTATNLLQQQKPLRFKAIKEGQGKEEVHYYLAALKTDNDEVFHFDIEVELTDAEGIHITHRFTRRLYVD